LKQNKLNLHLSSSNIQSFHEPAHLKSLLRCTSHKQQILFHSKHYTKNDKMTDHCIAKFKAI